MKSIYNKLKKFFHDPQYRFDFLTANGWYNHTDDRKYLEKAFYINMGYKLNLDNPITYNEKLQWLKLYDINPDYVRMADKYLVREFVTEKIGKEYLIPLLGVWDDPEEIDFNSLPQQFVLKCNHNSGIGNCICKDKSKIDEIAVKKALKLGLKQDYYIPSRERAYKGISKKIIAEKYMEDKKTGELRDYKFFTFSGEPKILFVASERQSGSETKFDFFDMDYNHLDILNGHPNASIPPAKPENFEEMIALSRVLSEGIPHVRVDFYEVDGKVYFGEMTFSHWGGMVPFVPNDWDYKLGNWITLPALDKK